MLSVPEPLPCSPPHLILASRSQRRRELLAEAGYSFDVIAPDESVEAEVEPTLPADELVAELALRKARDVAAQVAEGVLVACDTVAECDGHILGKPEDREHARRMLRQLSGREHRVYSGLCVWKLPDGEPEVRVEVTRLRMDALSEQQLEEYLGGGQWQGKAGAFGYQDRLGWVHIVEGSESNVVGLPMELLKEMLE